MRQPLFKLKRLLQWYRRHRRDLPWRRTRDPYRIWVSEVMLQQTQAATVIPYYHRFLKCFPAVHALSRARPDRLMKLWEGLGYYARARNLHAAAKQIMTLHGGRIPRRPEVFSTLPGAGPYTTAAVLSIAFGAPMAAVDGNVKRVVARLYDIGRPILPNDKEITGIAQAVLEDGTDRQVTNAGDFNQAMMELGARICTPRRPACPRCPLRSDCRAFRAGTVLERPVSTPRAARPHLRVVAGVVKKNGRVLIGRRPDRGLLGGLWEFPGGKIEAGETPQQALRRELREELCVDTRVSPMAAAVRHAYTHFSVTLSGHLCIIRRGRLHPTVHSRLRWVKPAKLDSVAMPEANRKLLRELRLRNLI
ncbi:A/G-specific adenine glycosylase [bacterium]|nr:A/G-specific adenine glycosylase [bacterium]